MSVFRIYEPHELGSDGYPIAWHDLGDGGGVKHLVREQAGHRCVRCAHPYRPGCGTWGTNEEYPPGQEPPPSGLLELLERDVPAEVERQMKTRPPLWSPCDERCTHVGPVRWRVPEEPGWRTPGWDKMAQDTIGWENVRDLVRATDEVQAAWRILTVHHLNERKHDLRWWNLAALCQRCHLYVQRKVQMERVYPWEHTDWFKPHAAGWYAYAYLGEDLTREQTMGRLDELLALECAVAT